MLRRAVPEARLFLPVAPVVVESEFVFDSIIFF